MCSHPDEEVWHLWNDLGVLGRDTSEHLSAAVVMIYKF